MSKKRKEPKRKHGCAIGCSVVLLIVLLVLGAIGVALFYTPAVDKLTMRLDSSDMEYSAMYSTDGAINPDEMTTSARQTYLDLQSCYNSYKSGENEENEPDDESESAFAGARLTSSEAQYSFVCTSVVEFSSKEKSAGDDGYAYGMVIYTDSVRTALEVFYAYYQTFSKNHTEAAESDYYLVIRGNTLVVGNLEAFKYLYIKNFI